MAAAINSNQSASLNLNDLGQKFVRSFPYHIRIDVACKHFSNDDPHRFLGFLFQRINRLCERIVDHDPEASVILWPTLFIFSEEDSVFSKACNQDRGTFLAGIDFDEDGDAQALDLRKADIRQTLLNFVSFIESTIEFEDERFPPLVSAVLVDRDHIDDMSMDTIIWPQAQESTPIVFLGGKASQSASNLSTWNSELQHEEDKEEITPPQSPPHVQTKSKFRTEKEVMNRLNHDQSLGGSANFSVIYKDRHEGLLEKPVDQWSTETTDEDFSTLHRIRAFRDMRTGEVVWHRGRRIDKVFSYSRLFSVDDGI